MEAGRQKEGRMQPPKRELRRKFKAEKEGGPLNKQSSERKKREHSRGKRKHMGIGA